MKTTKLFFDTEFTGLHQNTTLISIGIIAETGESFYAELVDYDRSQVNNWIKVNVIYNLMLGETYKTYGNGNYLGTEDKNGTETVYVGNIKGLKNSLSIWLKQFESVEMWSDCLAYDWVLFRNIFDHDSDLPENVYYIPFDICTLFKIKGIDPDISREMFCCYAVCKTGEPVFLDSGGKPIFSKKHNSLWDAKVIKMCYDKLMSYDKIIAL